jgi:hypothetical protein
MLTNRRDKAQSETTSNDCEKPSTIIIRSTMPEDKKSKKLAEPSHYMSSDEALAMEDERRRKKDKRRAKRLAAHLAELGLDVNGDPIDNFSLLQYPLREWKFKLPGFHEPVAINPVVTFIAVACLWGMVLWSSGKSIKSMRRG